MNKIIPITEIGLPYHGTILNNVLTTPTTTKTYLGVTDGAVWPLKSPIAPGASRSPEEVASDALLGLEWRNYALVSGANRVLGGRSLGQGAWVYCDQIGGNWYIQSQLTDTGTGIEVVITLHKVFGRFGGPAYYQDAIDRELFRQTFTYATLGIDGETIFTFVGDNEFSESGARCAFPVLISGQDFTRSFGSSFEYNLGACITFVLTGNGLLTEGSLGDGILCAVDQIFDYGTLRTESISWTGTEPTEADTNCPPVALFNSIDNPPEAEDCGPCGATLECCLYRKDWNFDYDYNITQSPSWGTVTTTTAKIGPFYDGETLGWFELNGALEESAIQDYQGTGREFEYIESIFECQFAPGLPNDENCVKVDTTITTDTGNITAVCTHVTKNAAFDGTLTATTGGSTSGASGVVITRTEDYVANDVQQSTDPYGAGWKLVRPHGRMFAAVSGGQRTFISATGAQISVDNATEVFATHQPITNDWFTAADESNIGWA